MYINKALLTILNVSQILRRVALRMKSLEAVGVAAYITFLTLFGRVLMTLVTSVLGCASHSATVTTLLSLNLTKVMPVLTSVLKLQGCDRVEEVLCTSPPHLNVCAITSS